MQIVSIPNKKRVIDSSFPPKSKGLPFPDGLEYDLRGPVIRTNIYLNLAFDSSDLGQYHVVHP